MGVGYRFSFRGETERSKYNLRITKILLFFNYFVFLNLVIFLLYLYENRNGYIVKKLKIITEENGKVVAKIIFNITLPAVILKITSRIEFKVSLILLPLVNIFFGFSKLGVESDTHT